MIGAWRCWKSRNEIREHLDEGNEISERTLEHLEGCGECAAMFKEQSFLVGILKAGGGEEIEAPFLRARILHSIQSGVKTPHSKTPRFVWAGIGLTAALILLVALLPREKSVPRRVAEIAAPAPKFELHKIEASSVELTGSLETEIESLKSDTQRAARALAASFTPSER